MSRRLQRFHTGMIVMDREDFPRFPYKGHHWIVSLARPDASLVHSPNVGSLTKRGYRLERKPELIISAPDEIAAQRVFNLILACGDLVNASTHHAGPAAYSGGPCLVSSDDVREILRRKDEKARHRPWGSWNDIPWSCLIAAKASRSMSYVYAIHKWQLSASISSVHYSDLDPSRRATIPKSDFYDEHVRFATAIILAYSSIEEIGFEVRASQQNPSSKNGAWNPPVLEDLEKRLSAGGIDLDEGFYWNVRGAKTRLEREKPKQFRTAPRKAPWTRWEVRDREVHIADAIAHASWLRSRVSSHKVKKEFMRVLSIYDVSNVQTLARRLILESLGYWRNHPSLVRMQKELEERRIPLS